MGIIVREECYMDLVKVAAVMRCPWWSILEVVKDSTHKDGGPRFEMCEMGGIPRVRATRCHCLPVQSTPDDAVPGLASQPFWLRRSADTIATSTPRTVGRTAGWRGELCTG